MRKNKNVSEERNPLIASKSINEEYKPSHWMFTMGFGIFLMILTYVLDSGPIYDMTEASRISGFRAFTTVGAFLLVLDTLLPVLFVGLKAVYCKTENCHPAILAVGFGIVIIFVAMMFWVRLDNIDPGSEFEPSRYTLATAMIYGILPLATSITSGVIFWFSFNPLKNEMHIQEQRAFSECEYLKYEQTKLAKYNADNGDYRTRLAEEEYNRYMSKFNQIKNISTDLKQYFRRQLARIIADPSEAEAITVSAADIPGEDVQMMEIPECLKAQLANMKGVD